MQSTTPLKRLFKIVNGTTPKSENREFWDGGIVWVTPEDLSKVTNGVIASSRRTISESGYASCGTTMVPQNSLVLTTRAPIGNVAVAGVRLCTNQGCKSLVPRTDETNSRFFYYQMLARSEELNVLGRGTTFLELSSGELAAIRLFNPPKVAQDAIAAFLDRETSKVDALVTKYERLLELLEEKRGALITHTVTKGLNPDAPMKDSRIDWIGRIPKHWHIEKTKFVAKLKSGHTPSRNHPEYWVDCNIPWVTLTDVSKLRDGRLQYVEETNEEISELGLANSPAQLLPAGTVIVSRTASVGYSAIMSKSMATTQDFVNWVCGPRMVPEYLLAVFRAMKPEFARLTNGSVHQTIYMPDVNNFVTPVPPLDEQYQIAEKVQRDTKNIFEAIDTIRAAITLSNERRAALITAAVTGQIDVRTYKAKDVEEVVA